jgi:hypothetical protein
MGEGGMDHLTSLDRGDGPATGTNGLLRLLAENSLAQLVSLADAVAAGVA